MAVSAARGIGGLEASFARIETELAAAGVHAAALVVGTPDSASASVGFLSQHLPTRVARTWRELYGCLAPYDVVHVHGATSVLWPARVVAVARLRRIPVVVTLHLPSHPTRQPRLRGRIRTRLRVVARALLLLASGAHVYAPSAAGAAVARRQVRPVPLNVRGMWNGVVDPGPAPVATAGALRLAFVGRLADHKRPLDFVAAVDAASTAGAEVTADIVGDGPLRDPVAQAISSSAYSDRFTMHGQCDDPSAILARCDLLVLTSTTEGGFPLVAMEAAAAGRGLLTRAGIEGLAEGATGGYVGIDDAAGPDAFAAEIVRLAADRAAVRRLGEAARARYDERFSATRAAESLSAAYDEAVR